MKSKIWVLLLLPILAIGQPPMGRYTTELFPNITETNNVQFSTGVPRPNPGGGFYEWLSGLPVNVQEYNTTPVNLKMDIFQPQGDTLSKRPVIIICFGGGFVTGSRTYWSIRLLCQALARRGFVTAAIDYRLGMNVFDSDLATRAVYRGLQDGRSAIRYFRADAAGANTYKVDPDNIFMGGHSAGSFIGLHNAYLDKETERPNSTYTWPQGNHTAPDQLCLDCAGDNQNFSGHANAIFSLAGAVGFTSYIESANDVNVTMFHSTDDDTVPFYSGKPFGSILWLVVGADLPVVYGSDSIATRGNAVGLNYDFHQYSNRGHGVHEDGSSALYPDIVPGISSWFFDETLKPIYDHLMGDTIVCSNELIQTYSLDTSGIGSYFDWHVEGGSFTQMSNLSSSVEVVWDQGASSQSLSVIPYSALDAKGDTLKLNITVMNSGQTSFIGSDALWSEASNWSNGHVPMACEDVLINGPSNITLDESASINSLTIGSNATLNITVNGSLDIYQKHTALGQYGLEVYSILNNQGFLSVVNKLLGNEVNVHATGNIENIGNGQLLIGK